MSTDIDTTQAPAEAGIAIPNESAPAPEVNDVEVRAKAMGWVPKEAFRGDETKWRSAEEFVQRGEEELPILRERTRDMARKTAELEARLERQSQEFQTRAQRQEQMAAIALRQQREYLESQWAAAKRQAVEIGDTQRFDQLERDHRQSMQQFDNAVYEAATPVAPKQETQSPYNPVVVSWQVQNPWFTSDPGLRQYAESVHVHLQYAKPGLTLEQNLAETAKMVREQFPDKFSTANGRPPSVEGGSGLKGNGKRERSYADLPDEAKRAAQEFVRAGAFKSTAEYAKSYWSMEQ